MKKAAVLLLCAILLCVYSPALGAGKKVECPEGGFSFTLPKGFTVTEISDSGDPDLVLLVESKKISLSVYISYVGNVPPDTIPFVLTGDETDMGTRDLDGRSVQYIAGSSGKTSYYTCCWIDGKDGVTLDFRYTGKTSQAMKTIDTLLDSLKWTD